eukprot:sb/3467216/
MYHYGDGSSSGYGQPYGYTPNSPHTGYPITPAQPTGYYGYVNPPPSQSYHQQGASSSSGYTSTYITPVPAAAPGIVDTHSPVKKHNNHPQSSNNSGYHGNNSGTTAGYHGNHNSGPPSYRHPRKGRVEPFKANYIYECPNTGQPIHCISCDVTMPNYAIAATHFNSQKHARKRMVDLTYTSDKRMKLSGMSKSDNFDLSCTVCNISPGCYFGYLQHIQSPKHLKKKNNIKPDVREFDIVCGPCGDYPLKTLEELSEHCKSEEHLNTIETQLKTQYPGIDTYVSRWVNTRWPINYDSGGRALPPKL